MSDPFEVLRRPDRVAPALPAAEVRRRGDRLRHRRTAFTAVGAAAALVVVVTGGALAGAGTTGSAPAPGPATQDSSPTSAVSPTPTPTRAEQPDGRPANRLEAGFPLQWGMPTADGDVATSESRARTTPFVFDPCHGTRAVPAEERTDFAELRASIAGGAAVVHQVGVYADPEAAHRAFAAFGDALDACPSHDFGSGSVDESARYGPAVPHTDESLVVVAHGTQDGQLTTLASHYVLVRVGTAVLVLLDDGEFGATRSQVAAVDSDQRGTAASIIGAMCSFRVEGCATPARELTVEGYGSLKIGMSAEEVADSPEVKTFDEPSAAACRTGTLVDGGGLYWSKAVGLVSIWAGGEMRTAEGIHLGSSKADVLAAYPDGAYDVHRYWTVPLGADMELRIAMPQGSVEELMLTSVDQDCFG